MVRRLSLDQIEAALRAQQGSVSVAAQSLGVTPQAIYQRIERSPHLRNVLVDIARTLVDVAEAQIARGLIQGDLPTIRWFLERKGRDRGWAARTEITGVDGAPLDLTLNVDRMTDEQFALFEAIREAAGAGAKPRR